MRIKSICLVCHGSGKKLDQLCLGCRGYGWLFVEHAPQRAGVLDAPDRNRKALRIRTRSDGLYDRIISAVREYQYDYIYSMDIMRLRPMLLKDIAKVVGCDMVTVHHHLRDEYINGIEVRSMFSESVCGVSNKVVMQMIRNIVQEEQHPHSDVELQYVLQQKGITISRRTVTKYRKQISIPSACKRIKV
jgi:RNA polymerase sigma-54 factor